MIPRQLFFIWFSEIKPFVLNSVNSFKNINKEFNIELIYEKEPEKSNNKDIIECKELINTRGTFYNLFYNNEWYKNNVKNKYVRYSAVFRFFLLNKYGGIYIDCDTKCLEPFDEYVINRDNFSCLNIYNKNIVDIFFIGNSLNKKIDFDVNYKNNDKIDIIDYNKYFIHYKNYSWKI